MIKIADYELQMCIFQLIEQCYKNGYAYTAIQAYAYL